MNLNLFFTISKSFTRNNTISTIVSRQIWGMIGVFLFLTFCSKMNGQEIIVGAARYDDYASRLKNKNVAIACNAASMVGGQHVVDFLLAHNIKIVKILAPEHGFRGDADAGQKVNSSKDSKTGIAIQSLYGENKKPKEEDLKGIDIVIFDIQDVGVRFYTYISTLQYILESCGNNKIPVLLFDRPNPNAHYVDGPVLDMKYKSFVGMQPVPIVYGMTIGEYANMLIGQKWLNAIIYPKLTIVECQNYTHKSKVVLTTPPSPNLKSEQAIALYPSLCLFEGTHVSVGRGTDYPFEVFGSPFMKKEFMDYQFKPKSLPGATQPPFLGKDCYGIDLRGMNLKPELNLDYLFIAYNHWNGSKDSFFLKNLFFDKLSGNSSLRTQIASQIPITKIRASWEPALSNFKKIRAKYLIYEDGF